MKHYFLSESDVKGFVTKLMAKCPVIGPVAKKNRFVFRELVLVDELRLDYDTTILPPKKVFFPTRQNLVEFDGAQYKACINAKKQVLFGVHPHDLKAIAMTDKLFQENNTDRNYLANREATVIVGTNVQNPYKHAFFSSISTELPVTGHDLFITKISGGYVLEVITSKGEELLSGMALTEAGSSHVTDAKVAYDKSMASAPVKFGYKAEDVKAKVRSSFKAEFWNELSKDCFSCGSCNMVCPTCYCFDVQDEWGLKAANGTRYRRWDACLTPEFSEVSSHAGNENFREDKASRYRHRIMRKTSYLNEKLGAPACIGCGRCSGACTADIADPVKTIKKIMES